MALTENAKRDFIPDFQYRVRPVAAGTIEIFEGAICNLNAAGYLKLGTDTAGEVFGGIADQYLDQVTGGSNGDNSIRVFAAKSGVVIKLTLTGVAITDIGADAFVNGDDVVALAATTTNDVRVGTIVDIGATNEAYIVLD